VIETLLVKASLYVAPSSLVPLLKKCCTLFHPVSKVYLYYWLIEDKKKRAYCKSVTKFRLQRPVVAYDVFATVELYLGVYYLWSSTILYPLHRTGIFASRTEVLTTNKNLASTV
jgi:hypothetical protein